MPNFFKNWTFLGTFLKSDISAIQKSNINDIKCTEKFKLYC